VNRVPAQSGLAAGIPPTGSALGAPLYDFAELREANTTFWGAVIERSGLPAAETSHDTTWNNPTLAQVCAYGFVTELSGQARLLATPSYRARGADGPFLRSAVLVRAGHAAQGLSDLRGLACAFDRGDFASRNLLRAETAVLSRNGGFFGRMIPANGPLAAINSLAEGEADAVLVDGAALAHTQRLHSALASQLRLILWTARGPGPPLVTTALSSSATVAALRLALTDAIADPALAPERGELLIRDVAALPESQYRALLHFEQMARSQGYPELK
jgi:ABC-type phosphate/phosphonate transport system substrate-binding protein